jgi:hypothetical protein
MGISKLLNNEIYSNIHNIIMVIKKYKDSIEWQYE